jgi:Kef-type K+ transport system membrane component KefB
MSALFRRLYGSGPLHLLALVASFALAAAALSHFLDTGAPVNIAVWFVGAVVLHDLVLWPLYAVLDRVAADAGRRAHVPPVNYIRVPAFLSALALLVYFPLILRVSVPVYEKATGQDPGVYLGRWLWITGALFAGSALLYAVALRRAGKAKGD